MFFHERLRTLRCFALVLIPRCRYSIFEIPSNVVLKRLRPSIWLPAIMVAWGIVVRLHVEMWKCAIRSLTVTIQTTLTGLVQGFHGLIAVRLFLGATEAGLVPGVAYYLTMWYPRYEVSSLLRRDASEYELNDLGSIPSSVLFHWHLVGFGCRRILCVRY